MGFEPEIVKGDPLYETIVKLVKEKSPRIILEIGSASGLGSTQAFIEGVENRNDCKMFCIEADPERYKELVKNCSGYGWIKCINASSVPVSFYMTRDEIDSFMKTRGYRYNIIRFHNLKTVHSWRDNEIKTIEGNNVCQAGISDVYSELGLIDIDMVLIDGSPFTAMAELDRALGAKVIILDDTLDIKCSDCVRRLLFRDDYVARENDSTYRNGYAVFEKVV